MGVQIPPSAPFFTHPDGNASFGWQVRVKAVRRSFSVGGRVADLSAAVAEAQIDARLSWYDSGSERAQLSKDDLIDIQGLVTAVHSGGLYRVESDTGHEVLAQLSGRMRRFRIKVVPGDRVKVGVSPYDPTRGLITYRER